VGTNPQRKQQLGRPLLSGGRLSHDAIKPSREDIRNPEPELAFSPWQPALKAF
jgi:hypothetical protein